MADRIDAYLDELRARFAGADPALVQDAVFDADEYLRAAVAGDPDDAMVAAAIADYGTADEVAAAYRAMDETVAGALRAPRPRPAANRWGRFLGVFRDPKTLAAYAYLLTAIATGFAYFFIAVGGGALGYGRVDEVAAEVARLAFVGLAHPCGTVHHEAVEEQLGRADAAHRPERLPELQVACLERP